MVSQVNGRNGENVFLAEIDTLRAVGGDGEGFLLGTASRRVRRSVERG
jgi:hypothetical protein